MKRAALVLALVLVGCSTSLEKRQEKVIREAQALLNHPQPGDIAWEMDRRIFFEDAASVGSN